MIDVNALKGVIVANGYTQKDMAELLGIAPKTFYEKMKNGVFDSDEIQIMIDTLQMENPLKIFFTLKVT